MTFPEIVESKDRLWGRTCAVDDVRARRKGVLGKLYEIQISPERGLRNSLKFPSYFGMEYVRPWNMGKKLLELYIYIYYILFISQIYIILCFILYIIFYFIYITYIKSWYIVRGVFHVVHPSGLVGAVGVSVFRCSLRDSSGSGAVTLRSSEMTCRMQDIWRNPCRMQYSKWMKPTYPTGWTRPCPLVN